MLGNVKLEFAARSDTGRVRPHNEDAIAVSEASGIAIVADGMGGYNAGEVASRIAASVLKESLEEQLRNQQTMRHTRSKRIQKMMVDCIVHANFSIIEAARLEPKYSGMGTTLVAALFHHDKVTVAHVGDSRAYRFRDGILVQITRDHSLLQEQLDAGLITPEEAPFSQNRNLVTRAMGVDQEVDVEIHDHVAEAGDVYLLCSDGLSDMLSYEEMTDILTGMDSGLQDGCDALVDKANANGGRDNISVVLAKVGSGDTQAEGMFDRLLGWMK
jgi:PPM family protein phosphatase